MKKLMSFFTLFLGLTVFTIAQTNITFHITSKNGKIFTEERGTFNLTFGISGLQTDDDVNLFKKTISDDSNVKYVDVSAISPSNNQRRSNLMLVSKDSNKLKTLFTSAGVKKIIIDKKEYSIDDFDKMVEDLKASKKPKSSR